MKKKTDRPAMKSDITRLENRLDGHDKNFVSIDKRFDDVDKRFAEVDMRFDAVDKRFGGRQPPRPRRLA